MRGVPVTIAALATVLMLGSPASGPAIAGGTSRARAAPRSRAPVVVEVTDRRFDWTDALAVAGAAGGLLLGLGGVVLILRDRKGEQR